MLDVDALAAEIRRVDGSNSLGAGALAEALMPFIKTHFDTFHMRARGIISRAVPAINAMDRLKDVQRDYRETKEAAPLQDQIDLFCDAARSFLDETGGWND